MFISFVYLCVCEQMNVCHESTLFLNFFLDCRHEIEPMPFTVEATVKFSPCKQFLVAFP